MGGKNRNGGVMRSIPLSLMLLALLCRTLSAQAGEALIEGEYSGIWPFTVAEGEIDCVDLYPVFRSGDATYGLTLGAIAEGHADIAEIRRVRPDLAERFGEAAADMGVPLPLVNMDVILERALALCDD